MAKLLKLRRGTTSQHSSFTGAEGEVTVDTDKESLVVHNGSQAGGFPLLRQDLSNLPAGTIDNSDVASNAAIAGTKISPNFGSQSITTTGGLNVSSHSYLENVTLTAGTPSLNFVDSGNNPDYMIQNQDGKLIFVDTTTSGNTNRMVINTDGHVDIAGNLDLPDNTSGNASLRLGNSQDFFMNHNGTDSFIINNTGNLYIRDLNGNVHIQGKDAEEGIIVKADAEVELYYNGNKTLNTFVNATHFHGNAHECNLDFKRDNGNRIGFIGITSSGRVELNGADGAGGNYETYFQGNLNGSTKLYYDNDPRISTLSSGIEVYGPEGTNCELFLSADEGDDNSDKWKFVAFAAPTGTFGLYNYTDGAWEQALGATGGGSTELFYDNWRTIQTTSAGATIFSSGDNSHVNFKLTPKGTGVYATLAFTGSNGTNVGTIGTHSGADTMYYQVGTHLFHFGSQYRLQFSGTNVTPYGGQTVNLGTSSAKFNDIYGVNIYAGDIHLSNEGDSNDVDGSWGDWTMQEGESDLFLKNNRSGKKYKFNLTEVS